MDMRGDRFLPRALVVNADSRGCLELREWLHDWPGHITSYSVEETSSRGVEHKEPATFVAYDVKLAGETSFRVRLQEQDGQAFLEDKVIHLQIPGIHNIQNALAALAAAHTIGLDADVILSTLENFGGIGRRFEIRHQGPLQSHRQVQHVALITT